MQLIWLEQVLVASVTQVGGKWILKNGSNFGSIDKRIYVELKYKKNNVYLVRGAFKIKKTGKTTEMFPTSNDPPPPT